MLPNVLHLHWPICHLLSIFVDLLLFLLYRVHEWFWWRPMTRFALLPIQIDGSSRFQIWLDYALFDKSRLQLLWPTRNLKSRRWLVFLWRVEVDGVSLFLTHKVRFEGSFRLLGDVLHLENGLFTH